MIVFALFANHGYEEGGDELIEVFETAELAKEYSQTCKEPTPRFGYSIEPKVVHVQNI